MTKKISTIQASSDSTASSTSAIVNNSTKTTPPLSITKKKLIKPTTKSTSPLSETKIQTPPISATSPSTPPIVKKDKLYPKSILNSIARKNALGQKTTPAEPVINITAPPLPIIKSGIPPIQKIKTIKTKTKLTPKPIPKKIQGTNFKTQFLEKMKTLRFDAIKERLKIRDDNLIKIIDNFTKQDKITNDKVETLLSVSNRSAARYLRILHRRGRLAKHGKNRGVFYQKYT